MKRLARERSRREPAAADHLRVDRAGRPRQDELVLGVGGAGARDDDEVGSESAGRQDEIDRLGVAVEGHDQCLGPVDAGLLEDPLAVGLAGDVGDLGVLGQPTGVAVDDQDPVTGRDEVLGGSLPDTAEATDDDVVAQRVDLPVHAAPLQMFAKLALGDRLHQQTEVIEHGAGTQDDEGNREDLAPVVQRVDLTEPDGRDRGDGLIEGVDEPEPQQQVADRAHDQDDHQHADGLGYASPVAHVRNLGHRRWRSTGLSGRSGCGAAPGPASGGATSSGRPAGPSATAPASSG